LTTYNLRKILYPGELEEMVNTRRRRGGASTRKNRGLVSKVYSPIHHAFMAGEEAVAAVTNTARNVVSTGIRGVDKIGRSVTGHADAAVRNVFSRRRSGGARRKSRKASRKGRKASRKGRKASRKSRKNRRN
jgi:hypothetical protein